MSLCDSSRDFFYLHWSSSPINLEELLALGWPSYNSKSSKSNKSASPFRKRVLVTLKALIRASYLAGGIPTKGNNRRSPVPAIECAPTPAIASVAAPLVAFGSADSFVVRYLEDDLQKIVRTIFEAKSLLPLASAFVSAPIVATAPYYEGSCEWLLKARFPDVYCGKTHIECYNFF